MVYRPLHHVCCHRRYAAAPEIGSKADIRGENPTSVLCTKSPSMTLNGCGANVILPHIWLPHPPSTIHSAALNDQIIIYREYSLQLKDSNYIPSMRCLWINWLTSVGMSNNGLNRLLRLLVLCISKNTFRNPISSIQFTGGPLTWSDHTTCIAATYNSLIYFL